MHRDGTPIYTENTSVSLIDVFFYVLGKWRALIVFLLAGALLGGLLCYSKMDTAKAEAAIEEAAAAAEELAAAEEALAQLKSDSVISESSYETMEIAYRYRQQYETVKSYIANSLYMQLDADGFYKGYLRYFVTDSEDAADIANQLQQMVILEEDIWYELAEASGLECSPEYLYEVAGTSLSGDVYVYCYVNSVTEESCLAMLEVFREKVEAAAEELQTEFGSFTLTEYAESVQLSSDDVYLSTKNTYLGYLESYYNKYTSLESAFNSAETAYYQSVYLAEEESAEAQSASDGADETELAEAEAAVEEAKAAAQEAEAEAYALAEAAGIELAADAFTADTTAAASEEEEEEASRTNPYAYLIAGIILAAVLWFVIFALKYLCDKHVREASDITKAYGLLLIGRLAPSGKAKKGLDAAVERWHDMYRGKPDSPEFVEASVRGMGLEKAVLGGDMEDPAVREFMEGLAADAGNLEACGWVSSCTGTVDAAKAAGTEILVVRVKHTTRRDVQREIECCGVLGIEVAGVICV